MNYKLQDQSDEWSCYNDCESASQCQFSQHEKRQKIQSSCQMDTGSTSFYNGQQQSFQSCPYLNATGLNYMTEFPPQNIPSFPQTTPFQGLQEFQTIGPFQNTPQFQQSQVQQPNTNQYSQNYNQYNSGQYFQDQNADHAPCQGPQPWNYAYCYGFYGESPCQFADVTDMEDFM